MIVIPAGTVEDVLMVSIVTFVSVLKGKRVSTVKKVGLKYLKKKKKKQNHAYFISCCNERVIACRRQLDVVFLLDLSGSVDNQYDRIVAFTRQVVLGLDMAFDRTRIGVATFGDRATVQFDLNTYRFVSYKSQIVTAFIYIYIFFT